MCLVWLRILHVWECVHMNTYPDREVVGREMPPFFWAAYAFMWPAYMKEGEGNRVNFKQ